ncbi:hypothetical protein [Paraburkholderia tropica]|uniref:hypothetical protein n=1 Tax=Paraburkholderia tropica TaxID=92647 RepID=UPI002AB69CF7|nr:hypothetical protein [Paraburkholderia tropica]
MASDTQRCVNAVISTAFLTMLQACAPTIDYVTSGDATILKQGQILYSIPSTQVTIQNDSAKIADCKKSYQACWAGAKLTLSSYVDDNAATYLVKGTSFSILYGKTDLSAELYDNNEPRLPSSVSIIYTNIGKNVVVAGGAAFVSLASFGVGPAIAGAIIAGGAADLFDLNTKFGLPANLGATKELRATPVDDAEICEGSDREEFDKWKSSLSTFPVRVPESANLKIDALANKNVAGCWRVLSRATGAATFSQSQVSSYSGWLYRFIRVGDPPRSFRTESLKEFMNGQDGGDLDPHRYLPVAACVPVRLQLAWWTYDPTAQEMARGKYDIPSAMQTQIFKAAHPLVQVNGAGKKIGSDAQFVQAIYLPKNGKIVIGAVCGGAPSLTQSGVGSESSDTISALIKAIGDSKTEEDKQ